MSLKDGNPLPDDIDKPIHDHTPQKLREYRVDYGNRPTNPVSFMSVVDTTSGRLRVTVRLYTFYFWKLIEKPRGYSFTHTHTHTSNSQTSRLLPKSHYGLLIRILTYQPTVDDTIMLSTNCVTQVMKICPMSLRLVIL
jgi:hypothetical protein